MYGIKGNNYEEYANESCGIKRLGILRADVDDLGLLFREGFKNYKYGKKLNTLSRYSMLSNKLSDFFKTHINYICSNQSFIDNLGDLKLTSKEKKGNVKIIYSGGDDLFIIGAWDEVIELAIILDELLKKYTADKIKLSAGIGIFNSKYPIAKIAELVSQLEELSKEQEGKNSITLIEDKETNVFSFEKFKKDVIGNIVYLENKCNLYQEEKDLNKVTIPNSLIYKLFNLYKNNTKRNLIQLAYTLGRIEINPDAEKNFEEIKNMLFNLMLENHKEKIDALVMSLNLIIYKNRSDKDV